MLGSRQSKDSGISSDWGETIKCGCDTLFVRIGKNITNINILTEKILAVISSSSEEDVSIDKK